MTALFFALFTTAYLAGSINFAIIFLKLAGKGDPRKAFSGNAGVTNVYRSAGRSWAAVILLLDVGRAVLLAEISLRFLPLPLVPWIGFALVLGNCFPCFHEFRGGKGVAAYLGFSILLNSLFALFAALMWVIVFRMVRIPFIASFVMISVLAVGVMINCGWGSESVYATMATSVLILFCHRNNIFLLTKGLR
jgi:glycerol-3-phosphate acyltransferase PlsY